MNPLRILEFFDVDEKKVTAVPLVARPTGPLQPAPETSYFRVVLARMSLEKSVHFFSERYPVVHSDVQFGVIGGTANVSKIITPEVPGLEDKARLSRVLVRDQGLSDLIVYRGGPIYLSMGLFSAPGEIWADRFIDLAKAVTSISGSISLGSALAVAEPVKKAIEHLTRNGAIKLMIGIKLDLMSPDLLDYEYLALVSSKDSQLEASRFEVVDNTLVYNERPLQSVDFILLKIDFPSKRDDLSKLIISQKGEALVRKTAELFAVNISQGNWDSLERRITKQYQFFIAQVFSCEVLTLDDRNRLIGVVRRKIMQVRDVFKNSGNIFRMRGSKPNAARLVEELEKKRPEMFRLEINHEISGATDYSEISGAMDLHFS